MEEIEQEELTLEFDGEKLLNTQVKAKASLNLGDRQRPKRHEKFAYIAKAKVGAATVDEVKGVPTLVLVGEGSGTIVDMEVVQDLLDEQHERDTGQMRMLTETGEARRAARIVLAERTRAAEELGYGREHLEQKESLNDYLDFVQYIEQHQIDALSELEKNEDLDNEAFLDAVEHEFVQIASVMLGGIEWTRIQRDAIDQARREAEAEARRAAEEAAQVTVDENGTAMTDEEVAEAKGEKPELEDDGLVNA